MSTRRLLSLLALAFLVAGCGGGEDGAADRTTSASPPSTAETATRPGTAMRVGLVTDVGGLDDRSFNFLANRGLERAESELGVEGRVVVSRSNADYVPNLSSLAQQGYDLVVGVGFLMADAVDVVARRFPDVRFAIVDFSQRDLKSKPRNVRGLLFEEQEAGYLVGYLAGLVTKEQAGAKLVIGSVGGQKIPPVDRYIAGYRAGARRAAPGIATLNAYSQDFVDQAKCKEAALDQIARGAHVVFQVAGQCGLGVLSAAKEQNVWGIGVDADQAYLGPHVLTSALKKVDVAVYDTIRGVREGTLRGGGDTTFDVRSGGVGLGEVSPEVPAELVSRVNAIQDEIAAGRVRIPTTVGSG